MYPFTEISSVYILITTRILNTLYVFTIISYVLQTPARMAAQLYSIDNMLWVYIYYKIVAT